SFNSPTREGFNAAIGGVCPAGYNRPMASIGDLALEPRRTFWAALSETVLAERERWPLWLPVLMGSGIAVYFALNAEPARWLGAIVLLSATIALLLAWRLQRHLA